MTTPPLVEHAFGGPWTEIKLDAISDYLGFYCRALKEKPTASKPFQRWYVDAFAGSGERTTEVVKGGLFEGPLTRERVQLDGSAKRALKVDPPFHHYLFVEQDEDRLSALRHLAAPPGSTLDVRPGDANTALIELFTSPPWSDPSLRSKHRAVVFLDPYGMEVRWRTLQVLAATKAVDIWYLFPLGAVLRQLARDFEAVDAHKQASLDEIFGTGAWRTELYSTRHQPSLFDGTDIAITRRTANRTQVEAYARQRLASLFPYTSPPLPLLTPRGAQLFSLFCVSANPSGVAHALIAKGVDHVLKKYR